MTMRSRSMRFLEIRVAQVERADDLFLVLAPLGRRVGDDRDRALRGDAVEVARRAESDSSASSSVRVAQVDGDRLVAELRVEDDVEVREAGERGVDVAGAGVAERQRGRAAARPAGGRGRAAAVSRDRSISVSSCVLPSRPTATLVRSCVRTSNRAGRRRSGRPGSARRPAAVRRAPRRGARPRGGGARARSGPAPRAASTRSSAWRASASSGFCLQRTWCTRRRPGRSPARARHSWPTRRAADVAQPASGEGKQQGNGRIDEKLAISFGHR